MLVEGARGGGGVRTSSAHARRARRARAWLWSCGTGRRRPRKLTLGAGTIEVRAPRVNDRRRGRAGRAVSASRASILPPVHARSPKVAEVLPILYLRGLSTGDFRPALEGLLGTGRSRAVADEHHAADGGVGRGVSGATAASSLAEKDYVYVWVDGIHFNVRLEDDRLCTLVMIGARPDGTKELIAMEDGYRESSESWATLLRDLKRRGMRARRSSRSAMARWASGPPSRDVWPETRTARCWCHKIANVLDKLPKRLQPQAKRRLHEVMYADTGSMPARPSRASPRSTRRSTRRPSRACEQDQERLLTHFDFPAEHWKHLRTTNIIESPFATVRLRMRVTKGAGSRTQSAAHGLQAARHGPGALAQAKRRGAPSAQVRAGVQFRRRGSSGAGDEGQERRERPPDHERSIHNT